MLAAEVVPVLLLGVPSGAVAARLGAKRTMLLFQLFAAPLTALIPVLHFARVLSLGLLLVLVFLIGTLWTPFYAAQAAIVPSWSAKSLSLRSSLIRGRVLSRSTRRTCLLACVTSLTRRSCVWSHWLRRSARPEGHTNH